MDEPSYWSSCCFMDYDYNSFFFSWSESGLSLSEDNVRTYSLRLFGRKVHLFRCPEKETDDGQSIQPTCWHVKLYYFTFCKCCCGWLYYKVWNIFICTICDYCKSKCFIWVFKLWQSLFKSEGSLFWRIYLALRLKLWTTQLNVNFAHAVKEKKTKKLLRLFLPSSQLSQKLNQNTNSCCSTSIAMSTFWRTIQSENV